MNSEKHNSNQVGVGLICADILRRLGKYRRVLAQGLLWTLIFVSAQIFRPVILKYLVDTGIPSGNFDKILHISLLYLGLLILSVISSYFQVIRLGEVGVKFIADMKSDLFDRVLHLDTSFFSANPSGTVLARLESDSEQIKELFSAHVIRLFSLVGVFSMAIFAIATVSIPLAICFSLVTAMIFLFLFFSMGYVRNLYHKCREAYKNVSGFLAEYIRGIPTIQAFRVIRPVGQRNSELSSVKYGYDKKVSLTNYSFIALLRFLTGPLLYSAIIFGIGRGHLPAQITLGTMIMIFEYCRFLFEPLYHLTEEIAYMQNGFASVQRIYNYMNLTSALTEGELILLREGGDSENSVVIEPENMTIEFQDVWFAYDQDEWVLRGVSFVLPGKERIGMVGPSGSGKTTIAKLLMRFYDPQRGRILINGRDIRSFSTRSLRAFFGLIMQDQFFFPGSLSENIRISGVSRRSDQELTDILCRLGMRDNRSLERGGLESVQVSEGAANFSSGERQIISLARVFDKNPGFLIMDEATAFVDHRTERDICGLVEELAQGMGQLIIAHRLSTIQDVNKIYVLRNGEIIEQGSHDSLMSLKGLYCQMYQTQTMRDSGPGQLSGEEVPA